MPSDRPSRTLAIIPARGGSKDIPRKNLRPIAGKPLISYAVEACLASRRVDHVVVSPDEQEIALFAERFGATPLLRPDSLSDDVTTLDPVIEFVSRQAEEALGCTFDVILTAQATSPLVLAHDIDQALSLFDTAAVDTVLSVVDDRHLTWTVVEDRAVPNYQERVNRQYLPANFRETGAIIACRRTVLETGTRIGQHVKLHPVPAQRSVDIDTLHDIHVCEALMRSRRIVFAVAGHDRIGLGHAYRALLLAYELVRYAIIFVCEESEDLAIEHIRNYNFTVEVCKKGELGNTILALAPDLVINDILDTSTDYMAALQRAGLATVNFEDMGGGSEIADLTINALYPQQAKQDKLLTGAEFFCLRDEFLFIDRKAFAEEVNNILLSFGGVDEGNLSTRVLVALAEVIAPEVAVTVVLGPGFAHHQALQSVVRSLSQLEIEVVLTTNRISDYMNRCDLAITSAGRTVYELASLAKPMLVICQNAREATHDFACESNGILNLGLRQDLSDQQLREAVQRLLEDASLRRRCHERLSSIDLRKGKQRVIERVLGLIGEFV